MFFQRFAHDRRVFARHVFDHHRSHVGIARLGERDKARKLRGQRLGECLPEIPLQVRDHARRTARDHFQLHRRPRAPLSELPDEADEVDLAIAQHHPLSGRPARMLEQHRIPQVRRHHVRRQHLQGRQRVLHHPQGIAGIQGRAHEILAGFFDHAPHFARLHVAIVVFDRNYDSQIESFGTHGTEYLNRVLHVRFDAGLPDSVGTAAQVAAHRFCAHGSRHAKPFEHAIARRRPVLRKCTARRADASRPAIHLDVQPVGLILDLLQVCRIEALIVAQAGDLYGVELQIGGVTQKLGSLPVEGAQRVGVEPELDGHFIGGGRRRGHGRGGSRSGNSLQE